MAGYNSHTKRIMVLNESIDTLVSQKHENEMSIGDLVLISFSSWNVLQMAGKLYVKWKV